MLRLPYTIDMIHIEDNHAKIGCSIGDLEVWYYVLKDEKIIKKEWV